jgi:hypothetical protein
VPGERTPEPEQTPGQKWRDSAERCARSGDRAAVYRLLVTGEHAWVQAHEDEVLAALDRDGMRAVCEAVAWAREDGRTDITWAERERERTSVGALCDALAAVGRAAPERFEEMAARVMVGFEATTRERAQRRLLEIAPELAARLAGVSLAGATPAARRGAVAIDPVAAMAQRAAANQVRQALAQGGKARLGPFCSDAMAEMDRHREAQSRRRIHDEIARCGAGRPLGSGVGEALARNLAAQADGALQEPADLARLHLHDDRLAQAAAMELGTPSFAIGWDVFAQPGALDLRTEQGSRRLERQVLEILAWEREKEAPHAHPRAGGGASGAETTVAGKPAGPQESLQAATTGAAAGAATMPTSAHKAGEPGHRSAEEWPGAQGEATRRTMESHFGQDFSGVRVHVDSERAGGSVEALAEGNEVHFAPGRYQPGTTGGDWLIAHELAHVVQQRGVAPGNNAGAMRVAAFDAADSSPTALEREADRAADRVVRGESVRIERAAPSYAQNHEAGRKTDEQPVEVAKPGIHKQGFIDNSEGANLRTGPAELGGSLVRPQPLPPATPVFVSGTHPKAPEWWYVTAHVGGALARGFVQHFRVTTELPEPTARLYAIQSGDTIERIAAQLFGGSVRPGHDLRYYENVVLSVNQAQGRKGVKGTFQDPSLFGGGANNIQLEAGHRIWLPSPAYAKSAEGTVPSGSLTGGLSQAGSFGGHVVDLMRSMSESPRVFRSVAGEYADAIVEHLPAIIGITGAILAAESLTITLAASPTGVSQVLALAIQAGLTAFGVTAAVETAAQAVEQGQEWLRLAWEAKGQPAKLEAASRAFCRMVVAIALAALALSGAAGSAGRAGQIAKNIKVELPPMAPAMALEGGGILEGTGTMPWPKVTTGGPLELPMQMSGLKGVPGDATSRLRAGEKERLGEGPEVDAMKETGRKGAGAARPPRHHVLPQEERVWFEEHGFTGELDIDNFCVEMEEASHQAIHGGGDWKLGRRWAGEWNTKVMAELRRLEGLNGRPLTPSQIMKFVQMLMKQYKIPADFVPYRGSR